MIKRYYGAVSADDGTGTPNTHFLAFTGRTFSPTFIQETEQLTGVSGAVLTLKVTALNLSTPPNPIGKFMVNGTQMFLNQTFPITLDGSGLGGFLLRVEGQAATSPATFVGGTVTIVGMTLGFPSSPISVSLSKNF